MKLEGGTLPATLAAKGATMDAAGAWRIPILDVAYVEEALRELRAAGAVVASLEVAEPELEEVFVKIMRREGTIGRRMTGFPTLLYKEVLRFWKVSFQTVAAPVLTTLLYLLVFSHALSEHVEAFPGVPYRQFLIPDWR